MKQADQWRICLEIKKLTFDPKFCCWRGSISYEAHTDHWCTNFSYFSYISIETNNGNNTTEKAFFGGIFHFCFEASWANLFVINSVESTNLAAQFDKQSSFFLPRLLLIELVPMQVSQQTSVMLCIWKNCEILYWFFLKFVSYITDLLF